MKALHIAIAGGALLIAGRAGHVSAADNKGDALHPALTAPPGQVLTLSTHGGQAPAGGCDAAGSGREVRVPYSADYRFWSAP